MHFMQGQIVCVCIYVCACESSSNNSKRERDRAYIYDEGERGREVERGRESKKETKKKGEMKRVRPIIIQTNSMKGAGKCVCDEQQDGPPDSERESPVVYMTETERRKTQQRKEKKHFTFEHSKAMHIQDNHTGSHREYTGMQAMDRERERHTHRR